MQANFGYEFVQNHFRPLERLRNVEFLRDWSLPFNIAEADEQITNAAIKLGDNKGNYFRYELMSYIRSDKYNGLRQTIDQYSMFYGWKLTNRLSVTTINNPVQDGVFFRPTIDLGKELTRYKKMQIGIIYSSEQNKLRNKIADTLTRVSFAFNSWQVYLKSDPGKLNKWGVSYFARNDLLPVKSALRQSDRSDNYNFFTELMKLNP